MQRLQELFNVNFSVVSQVQRDWYCIAEQPAPALHLAHKNECAALRIVLVTVPRVSRSCEHFPDGLDLHLLQSPGAVQCQPFRRVPGPIWGCNPVCKVTPVILHGVVTPDTTLNLRPQALLGPVTRVKKKKKRRRVILHEVVTPDTTPYRMTGVTLHRSNHPYINRSLYTLNPIPRTLSPQP